MMVLAPIFGKLPAQVWDSPREGLAARQDNSGTQNATREMVSRKGDSGNGVPERRLGRAQPENTRKAASGKAASLVRGDPERDGGSVQAQGEAQRLRSLEAVPN